MSVKLWIIFTFSIFNYQIKLHFRPECNGTMHLLQDKKFVRTEELTLDSPTALTDLSVICKVRSLVTGHLSLVTGHLSQDSSELSLSGWSHLWSPSCPGSKEQVPPEVVPVVVTTEDGQSAGVSGPSPPAEGETCVTVSCEICPHVLTL